MPQRKAFLESSQRVLERKRKLSDYILSFAGLALVDESAPAWSSVNEYRVDVGGPASGEWSGCPDAFATPLSDAGGMVVLMLQERTIRRQDESPTDAIAVPRRVR